MTTDKIAHGESYDLEVKLQDQDGDDITLDGTYSAKYRFLTGRGTGTEIAAGTMTIADGVATASIDTGDSSWTHGLFFWDVRITDPDGHEYVTEMVQLEVCDTITQPGA